MKRAIRRNGWTNNKYRLALLQKKKEENEKGMKIDHIQYFQLKRTVE